MRFAWIQKQTPDSPRTKPSAANRFIVFAYNFVWWIPIVLPFISDAVSYHAGFVAFGLVTIVRAAANLYRVNVLTPQQAMGFPLRQP